MRQQYCHSASVIKNNNYENVYIPSADIYYFFISEACPFQEVKVYW